MRVLIVGAGAVGGYFGGRLMERGRNVTFLVRPGRRAQLTASGLIVKSHKGDIALPVPTVQSDEITSPWDLIVVSCKAYSLAGAIDSFAAAVGPQTAILPLLNGMRHLDVLEQRFGKERVLGGLCSIITTLDADGVIHHSSDMHTLVFGERDGGDSPRVHAITALFEPVNAGWRPSAKIVLEMWEKWVFLSALAASTCLFRASIGDIVTAGGGATISALLDEAQAIAVAAGYGARPEVLERTRAQLTSANSPFTSSMLRDIEKGGAIEADHVIGDLLARGEAAGLDTPLLRLAYIHLKAYEARQQRQTV